MVTACAADFKKIDRWQSDAPQSEAESWQVARLFNRVAATDNNNAPDPVARHRPHLTVHVKR